MCKKPDITLGGNFDKTFITKCPLSYTVENKREGIKLIHSIFISKEVTISFTLIIEISHAQYELILLQAETA